MFYIALGIGGVREDCCSNHPAVHFCVLFVRKNTASPAKPDPPDKAGNALISCEYENTAGVCYAVTR